MWPDVIHKKLTTLTAKTTRSPLGPYSSDDDPEW
jgi:hypothetical protein